MPSRLSTARSFALQPLQGSQLKRYAVALLGMAAALALRAMFQPILGGSMHYISISAATAFAAWYCGLGPAILSTILGTFAANAIFLSPYRFFDPITERDIVGELLFLVFCAAVIAISESGRRALLTLIRVHDMLLKSRIQLKFRVRQRTAQLQQSNQDLRDLSARLLRVQDDERRRIARDLHDSTGQALTAMKLELAGIERELTQRHSPLAGRLASAIETARQISDDLRTISYLLHPPLLDELGLGSALRWYVDGFEKRSGIRVRLELTNKERLAPELETTLFRVVQECLINVHRHSGTATATIRLSNSDGDIIMEVEDEGRGITAEELASINSGAAAGVGFRGMRERIKDFGGELEILSSGRGTKVRAVIPEMRSSKTFGAAAESSTINDPAGNGPSPRNQDQAVKGASAD
jgi:signal transduction histidine kinase